MKNRILVPLMACSALSTFAGAVHGATIIEAHSSGLLNGNFSVIEGNVLNSGTSSAPGLTADHSVYSDQAATWVFSFTPGVDSDNWDPAAGTALTHATYGGGEVATGVRQSDLLDGGTGDYRVFITLPWTDNVSNPTTITLTDSADTQLYSRTMNQNAGTDWFGVEDGEGSGTINGWGLLATVSLTAGEQYSLTLSSEAGAVSQRVQGVMFEAIPEPSTYAAIFGGLALLGAGLRRFRRNRA